MLRQKTLKGIFALGAVASTLVLTSCFDAKAGIAITGDDLVNGNITITPDAEHATDLEKWRVPAEFESRMSKNITNQQTGETKVIFSGLGFEEAKDALKRITNDTLSLDIERTAGDQLSVSGQADLSHMPGANLGVAISFPGAITRSNGNSTNESTVQWKFTGGTKESLWATAPAGTANRSEFLLWTTIASVVGLLSFLLVVLWARRIRDMHDF